MNINIYNFNIIIMYLKEWLQDFLPNNEVSNILKEIHKIYPDGLISSDGMERIILYDNDKICVIKKEIIRNDIIITKQLNCERIERTINDEIFKKVLLFPTTIA